MPVKVGLEKFFDRVYPQKFAGKKLKIGVLSNSSAVDSNYCLLLDRLRDETDFKIHKIFAPEHGIFSVLQDMIPEKNKRNSPWGKQILSLYGKDQKSLKPKEDWLKGLDLIIFDIQDVGSR